MGSRALWLWIFLAMLGVTGVLGVAALLLPHLPYKDETLITAGLLTVYSLGALATAATMARRRLLILPRGAIVLLGLSLVGWLVSVWFERSFTLQIREILNKTSGTLTGLGILNLHSAMLFLAQVERMPGRLVRIGAIVAASAGVLLLLGGIWDMIPDSDWTMRVIGSLFVLGSLGTIATPILWRIERLTREQDEEHTIGRSVPVHLRCPRCGAEQTLPANRTRRCHGCGLKMSIQVSEPRCQCGYLLYGLPEAACPECGRRIADEHRWPTPDPTRS